MRHFDHDWHNLQIIFVAVLGGSAHTSYPPHGRLSSLTRGEHLNTWVSLRADMAISEPRRSTQDTSQGRMFLTARVTEALLAWWISLASAVSSSSLNSQQFLFSFSLRGAFNSGRYLMLLLWKGVGSSCCLSKRVVIGKNTFILRSKFIMTTYHSKVNEFLSPFFFWYWVVWSFCFSGLMNTSKDNEMPHTLWALLFLPA